MMKIFILILLPKDSILLSIMVVKKMVNKLIRR
jgi:hypothetical protein